MRPVDHIICVEPFGWQVGVLRDRDAFAAWLDAEAPADGTDWGDAEAGVRSFRRDDGGNVFVCFMPPGAPARTHAHEAVHLAWYVCDTAGVELDVDNHEVQAYLVGFFVREFERIDREDQADGSELGDAQPGETA